MQAGSKKYSYGYRLYRRLRYLRYVRKLRNAEQKKIRHDKKQEEKQRKLLLKEKVRADKIADRIKRINEQKETKQARQALIRDYELGLEENSEKLKQQQEKEWHNRKLKKHYRRHHRKRLLRFYGKACRKNTIRTLAAFNPLNLPHLFAYIRKNREATREFLIICLQSTLLFVAAYLMIFLVGMITSAISGLFFDYKSIIYHYEVLWLVKPEQWFSDSVKMIYASAPVLLGILAVFLAIIFTYLRSEKGLAKLFILWSFIHGFNGFFGSLLIGSLFGKGIGHAIIWSYVSDTEKVIYSILSITALVLLGVFTTRSFLLTANSYYPKLENRKFRRFVWAQVVLPFLIGNMILGAIMFPHIVTLNLTISLSLAITIITIAIGYRFYPALYFEDEPIRIRLRYKALFYALGFILLYRIVLGIGIPVG